MGMMMFMSTGSIFAMPSVLSGVARTLDLFGTFDSYAESPTPAVADQRAILSDVLAVSSDWKRATEAWAAAHLAR